VEKGVQEEEPGGNGEVYPLHGILDFREAFGKFATEGIPEASGQQKIYFQNRATFY
jgi:hypothetical protein